MSYQLKRIDPFWFTHPMIPTAVVIGGVCGLIGYLTHIYAIAGTGGVIVAAAIIVAVRPAISALLGTLGFLGGFVNFMAVPNISQAGMGLLMKLFSTLLFTVFYIILMDALVLVIAVLYNFYAGVVGMEGIKFEFESAPEEEPAA